MRKLLIIITLLLMPTPWASAECLNKVCVNVYTENGQLVIEGKKNGSTATAKPRVATTVAPKPKIKPTPTATSTATRKYTYNPRTTAPRTRSTTKSLADKVLQSLPTLQVAYQPAGKVLPKMPVIFWTDLPTYFNKNYKILGQVVSVKLKPVSIWSFGDGSVLVTDKVGKPYPSREITHSYSVPGTYSVLVKSYWEGSFIVDGIEAPIPGKIEQLTAVDVKVVGASTKFVGK